MKATPGIGAGHSRIAISSVFGPPLDPATWSAAPAAVAIELERLGFEVVGIDGSLGRASYAVGGLLHLLSGYGRIGYSEAIARGMLLRRRRASRLASALQRHGITQVLHTGTFDLPATRRSRSIRHFLYCDSTWNLSLRYRPDAGLYTPRAIAAFDRLERLTYGCCEHVFTFGAYVRDDLVNHYGLPSEKVTAVGSGCGESVPYFGQKDYQRGRLLFIAKHLFREKGGELLLEAFSRALRRRGDLTLSIVGGAPERLSADLPPNVTVMPYVDREKLTHLLQQATLLVQPMLNDPWGQVYLESLLARTPVVGLNRNGLPEITRNGEYGFLVGEPTPEALARVILDALSDPARLAGMAVGGQRHVLLNYSWALAAGKMAGLVRPAAQAAGTDRPHNSAGTRVACTLTEQMPDKEAGHLEN